MPNAKILLDMRGRPFYMGVGDYRAQVDQLSFRTGWRGTLHNVFLKAQYRNPFSRNVKKTIFQSVPDMLHTLSPSPVRSALFYDTSWYKETKTIGMIQAQDAAYFVKIHTKPEECLFEERQARFVHEMFSGTFLTAPIIHVSGNALVFQAIERMRSINDDDHIEERLLHVTKTFLDNHAITKNITECIPLDLYALCFGTDYAALGKKIRAWVEANDQNIRHIPVHGDMTPWNMFVNKDEKIVLVDYERAGWQVPFYDMFHFVLQPLALKKNMKALENTLYKKPWFHAEAMRTLLILYVIDQFYLDLTDHKMRGFNHPSLMNLIETKAFWLEKLLHDKP